MCLTLPFQNFVARATPCTHQRGNHLREINRHYTIAHLTLALYHLVLAKSSFCHSFSLYYAAAAAAGQQHLRSRIWIWFLRSLSHSHIHTHTHTYTLRRRYFTSSKRCSQRRGARCFIANDSGRYSGEGEPLKSTEFPIFLSLSVFIPFSHSFESSRVGVGVLFSSSGLFSAMLFCRSLGFSFARAPGL